MEKEKISSEKIPEQAEKRENVIENARKGRLELLGDVSRRIIKSVDDKIPQNVKNLMSHAIDFTVMANVKMGTEAIKGKTLSGEELNTKDRIMYGLIVTTSITAYGLSAYAASEGDTEMLMPAGEFYLASCVLFVAQKGPQLIKNLKNVAERYEKDSLVKFFTAFEKIIDKYGYENLIKLINKKNDTK